MQKDIPIINSNTQYLIRGCCAFVLFFGHYMLILTYMDLIPDYLLQYAVINFNLSRICITCFFVSSGFYIAINLTVVKEKAKAIGFYFVKTFWIKRILRIWPTYFVIIFLAVFVLSNIPIFHIDRVLIDAKVKNVLDEPIKLIYFFILLPQVLSAQRYSLDYADLAWSVGVEEIFYLFIPLVFFYSKHYFKIIVALFLIYFAVKTLCHTVFVNDVSTEIKTLLNLSEYENILIGSIVGVLVYKFPSFFNQITKSYVWVSLGVIILMLYQYDNLPYTYLPIGIAFAIIFAYYFNKESRVAKFTPLVFLGKISLSFYAFHQIGIVLCINLLKDYINIKENPFSFFLLIIPVATLLAYVGYRIIEEPFLNKKNNLQYQVKTVLVSKK
jgi:peptidoglycan/LPS O-acetylase OafA/YrhL